MGIARQLGSCSAAWEDASPLALALAGAATWYGWNWRNVGRFIQWPDDTYVGGEVTTIASKVAGFIDKIVVTDNEFLKAGDLLIKLDDRDLSRHRRLPVSVVMVLSCAR
jgi:multidrug resistance efflux pump